MEHEIQLDVLNEINESSTEKHGWIVEMKEELSNMESIPEKEKQAMESKKCIYKLPANLRRNFDPNQYEPKKVSFGPYHHEHDSCKQTQQIKKQVVLHSLKRHNKTIDDYVKALREVVQDLKDAYDELESKWQDDDDFLQLMIYDGCFILEILYERGSLGSPVWGIDSIRREELLEYYRHDMMLLENQIPMLVLERLLVARANMTLEEYVLQFREAREELHEQILLFISWGNRTLTTWGDMYFHVLVLHRHSLPSYELGPPVNLSRKLCLFFISTFLIKVHDESTKGEPSPSRCLYRIIYCLLSPVFLVNLIVSRIRAHRLTQSRLGWLRRLRRFPINIPSATELEKVGIGITAIRTVNLEDISFEHRILTVPSIFMDHTTKSRVLNIIAFEQVQVHAEKKFFSYFYFMSRLVQNADDVRLLQSRGIIRGPFLVNEVAEFFNNLIKDNVNDPEDFLVPRYHYEAGKLTKSFYNKMNNSLQKDLWQNYLKSPLGVFSLIAAFLLFALSVVQTVYTVLGYYNPK